MTIKNNLSDHWWMNSQPYRVKKNTLVPSVSSLSDESIIRLAEDTAQKCGYNYDGTLRDCIVKLGGELSYTDFWMYHGAEKGSIWILKLGRFKIWLSERASKRLSVFTIAHELGHYVVHYENDVTVKKDNFMIAARYGNGLVERQANIFAVNFLAPKSVVKKLLKDGKDSEKISHQICVDKHLIDQQIRQFDL